jgi:uncharacterized protein (DUF305 family)
MRRILPAAITLGAALALSACGSNDSTDTSQAAQAETDEAADPANAFADAETRMIEQMMSAVGTDAGDSWVRKMIVHHQGAIDMAQIMLQQNPTDHTRQMAQETIDKQTREIENLRKLIKEGAPNQQSADLYRPAMMNMQQAMRAAAGADIELTFMRKMLAHHEGGVALSDVALGNGVAGPIRTQATKTREGQQMEAEVTRAMLNGEPMPEATQAPTRAPASPATAGRPTPPQSTATSSPAVPSLLPRTSMQATT